MADTADDILYNLKYINNNINNIDFVIDYNSIYKYILDVTLDVGEFNNVKGRDIGNENSAISIKILNGIGLNTYGN